MGPETKKRDNDRTNKQNSFISLSAVKTELPSNKNNNNNTIIYIYLLKTESLDNTILAF